MVFFSNSNFCKEFIRTVDHSKNQRKGISHVDMNIQPSFMSQTLTNHSQGVNKVKLRPRTAINSNKSRKNKM